MTVRAPDPLNQFYRLTWNGTSWVKSTRWGTRFDSTNCMATQGALAIDAHTGGKIRSTPPIIRSAQGDQYGGIGVDDVQQAWQRLWGELFLTPAGFNFADTINAVRQGRYVVVAMDYGQLSEVHKCQAGGRFGHAMGLNDIRADGQIGYFDSLCTHKRYMPQYQMRRAMERTALISGRNVENLFIGLTRVRPEMAVQVTYRYGGEPSWRGRYKVTGSGNLLAAPRATGAVIRRLRIGEEIQARQTSDTGTWVLAGDPRWLGTADGLKWVWNGAADYVGPYSGREAIR